MADFNGLVLRTRGERAQVKVDQERSRLKNQRSVVDCWNPIAAKSGQLVEVEYQQLDERKAKLITYLMPVGGLLAGLAFGRAINNYFHWEQDLAVIVVSGLLWLGVALNYVHVFRRDAMHHGSQPVITAIEEASYVIDMKDD